MTFKELQDELSARLTVSVNSGFFTPAQKKLALNLAGQRVCGYYRWPFLELSVYITTADSAEYYDYPGGDVRFKPNSIYQITIDGEDYARGVPGRRRINWQQYQKKLQEDDDEAVFTNHNGFYFLNPIPTDGKEMVLMGLKGWQTLVNDTDEPISPEELDEAIIRIALATLLRKAKKYAEAKAELLEVYDETVGILPEVKRSIEVEAPQGFGGNAESSRWNN